MLDIADVSIVHNCDLARHFLQYPKYNESIINHHIYQNEIILYNYFPNAK